MDAISQRLAALQVALDNAPQDLEAAIALHRREAVLPTPNIPPIEQLPPYEEGDETDGEQEEEPELLNPQSVNNATTIQEKYLRDKGGRLLRELFDELTSPGVIVQVGACAHYCAFEYVVQHRYEQTLEAREFAKEDAIDARKTKNEERMATTAISRNLVHAFYVKENAYAMREVKKMSREAQFTEALTDVVKRSSNPIEEVRQRVLAERKQFGEEIQTIHPSVRHMFSSRSTPLLKAPTPKSKLQRIQNCIDREETRVEIVKQQKALAQYRKRAGKKD